MGKSLKDRHREFMLPSVTTYYKEPLELVSGSGVHVKDAEGREYLDFFGGILTTSVGHCHPKVVDAVVDQVQKIAHTSTLYLSEPMVKLAEKLAEITPGNLKRCVFTNSGTEANETAVLLARTATKNYEIIALRHAYSGRSLLAMSLTGQSSWRLEGTQFAGGVKHAHNPYCYRCAFGRTYPSCDLLCAKDLAELIETTTTGRVAGLIAEPIQGVGGFITPPKEYFKVVTEILKKYGGLFICDEVQTGFGRTGKRFGIEHWEVQPDIMTFAKGLANGAPIGATITTDEVADAFRGLSITTFGGNPVSMRAALATLEVIEEEHLAENCAAGGKVLSDGLRALQEKYPIIGEVRGMGYMQGLEIVKDPVTKEPAPDLVIKIFENTKERGLLIGKGGYFGNVIRITPPMTATKTEVQEALRILDESFAQVR